MQLLDHRTSPSCVAPQTIWAGWPVNGDLGLYCDLSVIWPLPLGWKLRFLAWHFAWPTGTFAVCLWQRAYENHNHFRQCWNSNPVFQSISNQLGQRLPTSQSNSVSAAFWIARWTCKLSSPMDTQIFPCILFRIAKALRSTSMLEYGSSWHYFLSSESKQRCQKHLALST